MLELFGHTSVSEVLNDRDSMMRFKEREMATMQWRLVALFAFSAKCEVTVPGQGSCRECISLRSNAAFRTVISRCQSKKQKLDSGDTAMKNLEYIRRVTSSVHPVR